MKNPDRATVKPCDEQIDGRDVRTWDVWRGGVAVASGFATRAEARREAAKMNAEVDKRPQVNLP